MVAEDVSLGETGVDVPQIFETTKQRLDLKSLTRLGIEIDIRR